MGPADLREIMERIPAQKSEWLLVGTDTCDDAAVFSVPEGMSLVQTLDFFTPIVDDPFDFGAIAAANALSDIYAMGAMPIVALNIACFPKTLGTDILGEIVRGGASKVNEAGAIVAGGHTVEDEELKFGLAVTGIVAGHDYSTNTNGKPGDLLYLTKPLGTGVIATALKNDVCPKEAEEAARVEMLKLNDKAAQAMRKAGAKAATDVTGFGFAGHLHELAQGSALTAEVWVERLPLLPFAVQLAAEGNLPGGAARNRAYLKPFVKVAEDVPKDKLGLLFDPQTSGGLLIAISEEKSHMLENALASFGLPHSAIGRLGAYKGISIVVRSSEAE